MTAIVGIAQKGKVWIGADSAGSDGYSMTIRKDPKVFINGRFIIGYTSSFRMGQLLEHCFRPPAYSHKADGDVMAYMVRKFIPKVRDTFKEGGYQWTHNERSSGGTFLVGFRGELFQVEDDYQVGRRAEGYDAVGCGADFALGSLYATAGDRDPNHRIIAALSAAASFSAAVSGPFTVLTK